MSDKIKVTLAYPYTSEDGVEHRADSTVSLPRALGNELIYAGRARVPDDTAKSASSQKEK